MASRITPRITALAMALLLLGSGPVLAAPSGPTYPLPGDPGDPDTRPGGSTCFADTDNDAAMGKTAAANLTTTDGLTWYFGGGSSQAPTGPDCPFSATPADPGSLPPFDTTRFARLFWGMSTPPTLALDGVVDAPSETLTYSAADSDLAAGRLVWTGSTTMQWCLPFSCLGFTPSTVPTRFVLTATDLAGNPAPLVDPATVGVTDPEVGGLVEVTPTLTNFKVNLLAEADDPSTAAADFVPAITMYNNLNHPLGGDPQTQMGFGGGFRWIPRGPAVSVALANRKLGAVIKTGIRGTLTVDEAFTASLKATISRTLANRLKIKPVVGKATAQAPTAASVPVTVTLTRAARSKLKTLGKVAIKVTAAVTNTAGDKTTKSASRTYKK